MSKKEGTTGDADGAKAGATENTTSPQTQDKTQNTKPKISNLSEQIPDFADKSSYLKDMLAPVYDPGGKTTAAGLLAKGQSGAADILAAWNTKEAAHKQLEQDARWSLYTTNTLLAAEIALLAPWNFAIADNISERFLDVDGVGETLTNIGGAALLSTRTLISYYAIKKGLESINEGKKATGFAYTGLGALLSVIHGAGAALEFMGPDAIINGEDWNPLEGGTKEYESAFGNVDAINEKLQTLSTEEQAYKTGLEAERASLAARIDAADQRIANLQTGNGEEAARIREQLEALRTEGQGLREHPQFNDGKETEFDRETRGRLDAIQREITQWNSKLTNALENAGELTDEQKAALEQARTHKAQLLAEQQQMDETARARQATFDQRREVLTQQIDNANKLSAPKVDTSDWSETQKTWMTNKYLLLGGSGVAFAVANAIAGSFGEQHNRQTAALTGQDALAANDAKPDDKISLKRNFMNYDPEKMKTLGHRQQLEVLRVLKEAVKDPQAVCNEMLDMSGYLYTQRVAALDHRLELGMISPDQYDDALDNIRDAHDKTTEYLTSPEGFAEIKKVFSAHIEEQEKQQQKPAGQSAPGSRAA